MCIVISSRFPSDNQGYCNRGVAFSSLPLLALLCRDRLSMFGHFSLLINCLHCTALASTFCIKVAFIKTVLMRSSYPQTDEQWPQLALVPSVLLLYHYLLGILSDNYV